MRISDWSSDVCSSDLQPCALLSRRQRGGRCRGGQHQGDRLPRAGEPARPGAAADGGAAAPRRRAPADRPLERPRRRAVDRQSVVEGKRVSVSLDLGGRRIITKKKKLSLNGTRIMK